MIPIHPSSAIHFSSPPVSQTIAVRGYSQGCGKTSLACALASDLAKIYAKVQVISPMREGAHGTKMQQYLVQSMGREERNFDINETAVEGYDATVYDIDEVIEADEIFYIAPKLIEDELLGIKDLNGLAFRESVTQAISVHMSSTNITFMNESDMITNASARWLAETDWIVLRDLERMHLSETKIGELRNYIRNTDLNRWASGIRL